MPDQTTPDDHIDNDHLDNALPDTPAESPWLDESSFETDAQATTLPETSEPDLDDAGRVEIAAFRENLDTAGGSSIWQDSESTAELAIRLQAQRSGLNVRPPGPGIPEAIGWMFGVFVVHLVGVLIALVAVLTLQTIELAADGTTPSPAEMQAALMALPETFGLELITIEMLVFLVSAVVLTRLRLGPRTSHLLGIRSLETNHILLIAAVAIPIALMCGGFHQITLGVWNEYFAHLPGMGFFDNLNVNESIKPLGESAPIGLLFLVIAVAPAIGEEVIFRGIIGRGLVARHGVIAGVIMTSVMFAAVHVHPAHVVALLPLAFFIHLTYLVTRSILAPMLLHLLNNSLAVILLKASSTVPALEGAGEPDMHFSVMLIASGIVGLVGWTLWRSRVEYQTDDGEIWNPGYSTVEMPPESVGASLTMNRCPIALRRGAVGLAGAYSLVFVVSLVLTLTGHISA